MRADKAIEWLSEYKPDEEIFIAWWDNTPNFGDVALTDEQWKKVVAKLDDNDNIFNDVTELIAYYTKQVQDGKA